MDQERFLQQLGRQAEENPMAAIGIGTALLMAVGKVIQAWGESAGSRAYARDVNRRVRLSKKPRNY